MPDVIDPDRNTRTISCDQCLVEVVQHLWKYKIQTKGCCCGHGEQLPSIVVSSGYGSDDIDRIEQLIAEVDVRHFHILQWQLICVNDRAEIQVEEVVE
jgi:hypothetical protein